MVKSLCHNRGAHTTLIYRAPADSAISPSYPNPHTLSHTHTHTLIMDTSAHLVRLKTNIIWSSGTDVIYVYICIKQGMGILSQVVIGDTFRMHFNTRSEWGLTRDRSCCATGFLLPCNVSTCLFPVRVMERSILHPLEEGQGLQKITPDRRTIFCGASKFSPRDESSSALHLTCTSVDGFRTL